MNCFESFRFATPLVEGIVEQRKSQFTMNVEVNSVSYSGHCPTTGRVGNLELSGRPCLLSPSKDPARKTAYTVEAISLNRPEDREKTWIGINQNAVNRYVEHYLGNGGFAEMVDIGEIHREQLLGDSKIDFLIGDTYLEVKTPLQFLQLTIPDYIQTKKATPFSSTERMIKHVTDLSNSLKNHQRAILLTCFIYDNPGFQVIERSASYEKVKRIVNRSVARGVELWQANFKITPQEVSLERYFPISV